MQKPRAPFRHSAAGKNDDSVLLEIDVDGHRSGIRPDGAELLPAAAALADGAELVGVLTHAGDSYECKTTAEIEAAAEAERAGIVLAAERLRAAGHTVKIVSAGSTPTLMFAKDETGVTEMRAGVCALFDLFMSNVGACTVDDIAGSVLATVIGRQVDKRRVILDCGFLALSATAARLVRHTTTATAWSAALTASPSPTARLS